MDESASGDRTVKNEATWIGELLSTLPFGNGANIFGKYYSLGFILSDLLQ